MSPVHNNPRAALEADRRAAANLAIAFVAIALAQYFPPERFNQPASEADENSDGAPKHRSKTKCARLRAGYGQPSASAISGSRQGFERIEAIHRAGRELHSPRCRA